MKKLTLNKQTIQALKSKTVKTGVKAGAPARTRDLPCYPPPR
jgi:hypothetical protein